MFKIYPEAIIGIVLIMVIALSANTSPPIMNDPYSGLYYVHGTKIVKFYNCPFIGLCGPDDGPFHDTTRIASVVAIKKMQEKTDTLHFFGLPGADEGEHKHYYGKFQIGDRAGTLLHYDELEEFRIYGSHSGDFFMIDFNITDRFYKVTGSIIEDNIEIYGLFTGRSISVEYNLQGEKIKINQ